jgi:hypothetical protein
MCPQACAAATLPTLAQIKATLLANDYIQQPDAVLSQANPVSNTVYNVLPATTNVKIESVSIVLTWAVTQPTNLRIIATVDGKTITHTVAAPISNTDYHPTVAPPLDEASQTLTAAYTTLHRTAFDILSGQNVQIDMAVTWGVTQPTPMVCRVKFAQRV